MRWQTAGWVRNGVFSFPCMKYFIYLSLSIVLITGYSWSRNDYPVDLILWVSESSVFLSLSSRIQCFPLPQFQNPVFFFPWHSYQNYRKGPIGFESLWYNIIQCLIPKMQATSCEHNCLCFDTTAEQIWTVSNHCSVAPGFETQFLQMTVQQLNCLTTVPCRIRKLECCWKCFSCWNLIGFGFTCATGLFKFSCADIHHFEVAHSKGLTVTQTNCKSRQGHVSSTLWTLYGISQHVCLFNPYPIICAYAMTSHDAIWHHMTPYIIERGLSNLPVSGNTSRACQTSCES